eukprot:209598_1
MNRIHLLKIFKTRDETDDFYDFIEQHVEQFVVLIIDITLDPTATTKDATDLSKELFYELGDSPQIWSDLPIPIKRQIRLKILEGITSLAHSDEKKMRSFAYVVTAIISIEEWSELILHLVDLNRAKYIKLEILFFIAQVNEDRLESHSLPLFKSLYSEISLICNCNDDTEIKALSTSWIFFVIDKLISNVNNTSLAMDLLHITMVFLVKLYVINYKTFGLFDCDLNINVNANIVFDLLNLNSRNLRSYEVAACCIDLLRKILSKQVNMMTLSSSELDGLFLILNIFTKVNADIVKYTRAIAFPEDVHEWKPNTWRYYDISKAVFAICSELIGNEKSSRSDDLCKYFKAAGLGCSFIDNVVSNVNYDLCAPVVEYWLELLPLFATHYGHFLWTKHDLFIPLLQMKHGICECNHVAELQGHLVEPEWLAVRYFVRRNYSLLYDPLYIPIMKVILKYFSQYLSIRVRDEDGIYCDEYNSPIELVYDVFAIRRISNEDYDLHAIQCNIRNQSWSKHRRECLIFGFLKTLHFLVPQPIGFIIYAFYPWIVEMFDAYDENLCDVGNENTSITVTKKRCCAYGRINISPKNQDIHLWTFKVIDHDVSKESSIHLGIVKSDECDAEMFFSFTNTPHSYAYLNGGYRSSRHIKGLPFRSTCTPYGESFGMNDTITMIFDAQKRILRFYKNGIDQHILSDTIDCGVTFKMAIYLNPAFSFDENDEMNCYPITISLISYERATHNDNN